MNFNNLEKRKVKVGSIEKEIMYDVLKDLPSGKRSYPDLGNVYVRGFSYGEILEISKINDEYLEDTLRIYREVIKFENPNYELEDLELVDYILLTSIVNIMTSKDFKWYPNFTCSNIVKNPNKIKLEMSINEFETLIKDLNHKLKTDISDDEKEEIKSDLEKFKQRLKELKNDLENFDEDEYVECGAIVNTPISLDNFEVVINDPNIVIPVYYKFSGVELELKPLTVRDYIDLEKLPEKYNKEIAELAKYIRNFNFNESYELIKTAMPWEIDELLNYIERLKVKLKPIKTRCFKCGAEYDLEVDLKDIKVLPRI